MSINEEEVKIRERLVSLETKLDYLSALLQEIKSDIKNQPSRDDYTALEGRLSTVENKQTSQMVKVGILSGILGMVGGLIIKFLLT